MDFTSAIQAHSAWKLKLSKYLRNPDGSLNPSAIRLDNQCELGKWLTTVRTQHPEIDSLHKRFHLAAANVVERANSGEKVSEEVALGSGSEFAKISSALVATLMKARD